VLGFGACQVGSARGRMFDCWRHGQGSSHSLPNLHRPYPPLRLVHADWCMCRDNQEVRPMCP
jgi:hypothetical protein